jgi:hypothetical protein
MQNATIDQLTSGGHKSIPGEHLPQARDLKINNQSRQCNNQSVNQWWVGLNHPQEASSTGSGSKKVTINQGNAKCNNQSIN